MSPVPSICKHYRLNCQPPVPSDYDVVLENYTKRGYRVIALAAKSIPALTWVKAQRLKR